MTRQSFWALKMSKKSFLGQSYGGLKKSAKICWRYPSLNSCHGHKLGRNVKISVTIGKPTTRRLFWAVKMSKKSIAGPSYGGLKKVPPKSYTKWGLPSLNCRHGHKLWRNQKISMPISKTIAWRLFWAVKFFKKVFPSLSYGQSKLVPNRGTFAGPEGASIASQCCSPFGPPSLRDAFFWGGLKGNCQKKYTMEVKTVKARKSDKVVSKRSKSTMIWD